MEQNFDWDKHIYDNYINSFEQRKEELSIEIIEGDNLIIQNNIRRHYLRNIEEVISNEHIKKATLKRIDNPFTHALMSTMFESYGTMPGRDGVTDFVSFKKEKLPRYEEIKQLNVDLVSEFNLDMCDRKYNIKDSINNKTYQAVNHLIFICSREEFDLMDYKTMKHFISTRIKNYFFNDKRNGIRFIYTLIPELYLNSDNYDKVRFEYRFVMNGVFL